MDEAWERAVEAALRAQNESLSSSSSSSSVKTLTLDGAVKCVHGRLPSSGLLEKFQNLKHLSIANIGLSSLDKFPRLLKLQRLSLSDNRIAGGLEFLVEAGLYSLRDLDLSNNRIQNVEDLSPLARLRLVSLDLYECPVTRVKDYRSRVFGMIRSLKYLDKMDADENERPESDEEEEDEEEEEEEEEDIDGDDAGINEIDGEDRQRKVVNGGVGSREVIEVVDEDEDEESDANEEETEIEGRMGINGSRQDSNGFHVAAVGGEADDYGDEEDDENDDDYEDEEDEIEADDGADDEVVVEVQDVGDSDEDDDGVQEVDDEVGDDDTDDEEVERELVSTGRLARAEGEIDGHDHGEEDENGEIGETDEEDVEEDRDSDDDDEVISYLK